MRPKVFISHSSRDIEAVRVVEAQATAAGVDVYLAEHDVRPGEPLADKIIREIDGSDAVIVLLTDQSAAAAFVQQEMGAAIRAGRPIIPLVQVGLDRTYLAMLQGTEYVEFDPHDHEPALRALTAALAALVEEAHGRELDRARTQALVDALLFAAVVLAVVILVTSADS